MSQLSTAQQQATAAYWATQVFVAPNATATFTLTQIQSAVAAVDSAFDTTLNAAVTAGLGTSTVAQALSSQITPSMPGATAAQQTLLVCYTLMKRAGII